MIKIMTGKSFIKKINKLIITASDEQKEDLKFAMKYYDNVICVIFFFKWVISIGRLKK